MNGLMYVRTHVYPCQGATLTTNLVNFAGSTGVVAHFDFGTAARVIRWGFTVDTSSAPLTPVTNCVLTLKKYPTVGVNTNAVSLGTISTGTANIAAGKGMYNDLVNLASSATTGSDGNVVQVAPDVTYDNRVIKPGQELVVELTTAATTQGKGFVWVQTEEMPLNITDMVTLGFTKVTA